MSYRYFFLWLPMIVLAFANATLREFIFTRHFNEIRAHQLSTVTLIILCSIYVWFVFPLLNVQNYKQALIIGAIWVLLTVVFEFSLGRLTNKPWKHLLQDYNLFAGHIWLLFLFSLFIMPYLFYFIKKR